MALLGCVVLALCLDDADVLARVAWSEDPVAAREVMATVVERATLRGTSILTEATRPGQYHGFAPPRLDPWARLASCAPCRAEMVALRPLALEVLLARRLARPGWTHFHRVGTPVPAWAPPPGRWVRRGSHYFYRLGTKSSSQKQRTYATRPLDGDGSGAYLVTMSNAPLLHVKRTDRYSHMTQCGRRVYSLSGATSQTTPDATKATCPKCYESANGRPIPEELRRPAPKTPTTTCQVCARPVLANSGKIAHHGYKRPGQGWQTASCFGARYRPYEVASDALPLVIEQVERFINAQEVRAAELVSDPPANLFKLETMVWDPKTRSYGQRTVKLDRPEGFDTREASTTQPAYGTPDYEREWRLRYGDALAQERAGRDQLKWFRERLASWKARS